MTLLSTRLALRATIPNPLDHPDLYDTVWIGGQESPGICDVAGAGDPRKWDKQDGQGASGATLKFQGKDLSEFEIVFKFWLSEHFEEWESFKRTLEASAAPPKTAKGFALSSNGGGKALEIRHPLLDGCGIRAVVVRDVGQLTQTADGEWSVTIKLTAWRKPKPAGGVPQGAKTKAGHILEELPPEDEYDKKIDQLVKELGDLAGPTAPDGTANLGAHGTGHL